MKAHWQTKRINEWQNDITKIVKDVEDALYSKYMIETIEKIIRSNDYVKSNIDSFWEYYKLNYTYFIISKIFHQIDEDGRSLSLINLLKDLLCNNEIITKQWWDKNDKNYLSVKTFEKYFGNGLTIDCRLIIKDIKDLKEVTTEIKRIRNKRIAHKNKDNKFSYSIKNSVINNSLKTIEELIIKYQLLFLLPGYDSLTPVSNDNWHKAFTIPWIKYEN